MKPVKGKMETLMKYVPFIDFVLKIDQQKYIKFINIRKWIHQKKSYPLSDFNKIEQSIITQYKNLLLENNVKIPQSITDIFAPIISKQFVNLCSDDEEDEIENKNENSVENSSKEFKNTRGRWNKNRIYPEQKTGKDSEDDDLQIVSVEYNVDITKNKTRRMSLSKQNIAKVVAKEELALDDASKDILNKIDKLAEDDVKQSLAYESNTYTFKKENCNSTDDAFYQRCCSNSSELFKRRADFKSEVVENIELSDSETKMDCLSLDSDIEESCIDNECPSTSQTTKQNETNVAENGENTDPNGNGSNDANKTKKKIQQLCNTIDPIVPDTDDLILDANSNSNMNVSGKHISEGGSDKENSTHSVCENNIHTDKTPNLTPEQLSKILEDISSKTDFELDTFYEALAYVRQLNSEQKQLSETPPPAPPISTNLPTPPVQTFYPQQQQQQLQQTPLNPQLAHSYPQNMQNSNTVPAANVAPPRPKISINDPRIRKQLHVIQNSPLYTYNLLNPDIEESIRKICQSMQPPPQQQTPNLANSNKNNVSKTSAGTHKSHINYGEYKRRQLEKKLEMERKREEELKAQANREREMLELSKNKKADIRSKLLSALAPCKEQLTALWKQQMHSGSNSSSNISNNNEHTQQKNNTSNKETNMEEITKANDKNPKKNKKRNSSENVDENAEKKLNRVYSALKCTVKGFDQIQDYIADETTDKSIENNLRRSRLQSDASSTSRTVVGYTPKPIELRRRSSIHALSAISELARRKSTDCSDSECNQKNISGDSFENSSTENLSLASLALSSKRRKTIDETIKPTRRLTTLSITDDDDSLSCFDNEKINNINIESFFVKVPVIKLRRMSENFIRKHTRRLNKNTEAQTLASEQSIRLNKNCEVVLTHNELVQKTVKLKKYNNDCQMTERNTNFCVLCRSKPSDLTNHYIGRHKTESYVSRLDWTELDELEMNTPFAKLQPRGKNYRFDRYEVECAFCKEKLYDQFINFYNHYSAHTGEYAFQCSHCHLTKPYKPDIQSHILHSKTCRNSSIQIMYRYPPQAQCIYLHYCTICNFVQLNEANVLKHLREHHDYSKAIATNVQKCILAAMNDGPEVNEINKSTSPTTISTTLREEASVTVEHNSIFSTDSNQSGRTTPQPKMTEIKFKVDDDDIPVSNEPCIEDENMAQDNYSLEQHLESMHEGSSVTDNLKPITIIHSIDNILKKTESTGLTASNSSSSGVKRHLPMKIKMEALDTQDNFIRTSSSSSSFKAQEKTQIKQPVVGAGTVYERYRSYPPNVNYLGLYKCMIDDCYYSTDCSEEMVKHLTEHSTSELKPNEYLQCPYCILTMDTPITPSQLVEHVRTQHEHLIFQCSMCCYRSCDASNVLVHQQTHHSNALNNCKIYKCSDDISLVNNRTQITDLNDLIANNIFRISCKFCNAGFFHSKLFVNHIHNDHMVPISIDLQIFSCIYCPFTVDNINQISIHNATKHPGSKSLIYDHNKHVNINEDFKNCSNVVNISAFLPWPEIQPTVCPGTEENIIQDVKPNVQELLRMNEETVKVRLQKLTSHTGVPPDSVYRCPKPECGGFFSDFELWLRHMKSRHHALECQCPHCPTVLMLPLEQFRLHFEQHRRHTFICFYCSITNPNKKLAIQHAAQNHSDLGIMRFEEINFNLGYSYSIVIQNDLFKEREVFISEFMCILDNRLKEIEDTKIKNLKQQWPVRYDTPWLDEYLQILSNRKVARRCLVKECNFITLSEENLYRHLSTTHTITGTQFNCSKCDYHVEKCNSLDELFNHIKLHNEYIFICVACSLITSNRTKMSSHIAEQHSARDVPVIHLFRTKEQMYIKISIVFSDYYLTFSTMKNCFCCSEQNMGGDVFSLHLKHYHKLSLNYYCENCTNFSFESLKEVKPHFQQFHSSNKFKIRCELAGHNDLHVVSLNDFQIEILTQGSNLQQTSILQRVKNEPMNELDNDVIFIEDDDIEIQKSLREEQLRKAQIPKLKCTSLSKLMETPTNTLSVPYQPSPPPSLPTNTLSVPYQHSSSTSFNSHFLPINPILNPCPSTSFPVPPMSSHIGVPSVVTNTPYLPYRNTIMPSNQPANINPYTPYAPNRFHMQNQVYISTNESCFLLPQNANGTSTQYPTNNNNS